MLFFSTEEYHYNAGSTTEETLTGLQSGAAVINIRVGNLANAEQMS